MHNKLVKRLVDNELKMLWEEADVSQFEVGLFSENVPQGVA